MLNEVYVWSKLEHENIIKLLGITTSFNQTVSIVLPLMSRGNVFDYVQNPRVDPRPLVCYIIILHFPPIAMHILLDFGNRQRIKLPPHA